MHLNIRSLQKHFHKLQSLLCDVNPTPDLIALSETWHNSSSFFIPSLPGYEFISSSFSCNKAGGVAIFLKSTYNYSVRSDLKIATARCKELWLEVQGINNRSAIIGVVYRHPGCKMSDLEKNSKD